MRPYRLVLWLSLIVLLSSSARAQDADAGTRQALIEQTQAQKAGSLQPYPVTRAERAITRVENIFAFGQVTWHPFFESAAQGGGFTLGAGYTTHVSPYNFIDVRGSYSIAGYRRAEAEFFAPRLFNRRGTLSVLGGWRAAGRLSFYGLGPDSSIDNLAHYGFQQGYGSALLTVRPTRKFLLLRGGAELARWSPEDARGGAPAVESIYSPATLPGLGTTTTYVHTQGTVGLDWRPSPGYARRGGFYGITAHDYHDGDNRFGFRQVDYEVIQHVPILREAWVVSLRGRAQTTSGKSGQDVPYFLVPHLGGGSTLRGYDSWRFRDRNALLLQAEWRIMVNRFMDTALFYDAGKVAARTSDLDFDNLKSDYGFGVRFHGPFTTAFRVEVARSREGTRLVVSTSPVF